MGGYCPVSLLTKGLWTRGQYNEYVQVDQLVFYTAGPAEREAMAADKARFVPALGGNCVVSMVDDGHKVRGSVHHSTLYQNRLFLFANAEMKTRFDSQPSRYSTIDLAANGDCVVTRAETGEAKPGFAEFAVWFDGLLYRFASDAQKQKFLKTPEKYAGLALRPAGAPLVEPPAPDADGVGPPP
jgi:YHS domain-containing protein